MSRAEKNRIESGATARAAATASVRLDDVTLFDIYRAKPGSETAAGMTAGEKSMALRLALGSEDGENLTDERIDAAVKAVLDRLRADLDARLRA